MAEHKTKIKVLDNGPHLVKDVVVIDAEGNQFHSKHQRIALCRCGGSTTNPFCDATHSKIDFQAAERAV